MITDPIAELNRRVRLQFADEFADRRLYHLGIYNRRFIAGTTTWSQHAWGNAMDIGVARAHRPALGDRLKAWIRTEDRAGRLDIGLILWQVRSHYDHLHIEGSPKMYGTPPLPGGESEEDMSAFIEVEQENLNTAGFTDSAGNKLNVDGVVGPKTQSAMLKRDIAAQGGSADLDLDAIASDIARRVANG